MSRLWLIVPAAGQGRRMGADRPKQYLELDGRPVLAHTLSRLYQAFPEAGLCLCLDDDDRWFDPAWVPFADWLRSSGGIERADTVSLALARLGDQAGDDDLVLVHDVARPCVSLDDLTRLRAALEQEPAGALLATPVADTMKRADAAGRIATTEPRSGLWHAQTPQGFRVGLLRKALEAARLRGVTVTDEASAVEALGLAPRLVMGRRDNFKITHPEDLALAAHVLAAQAASSQAFGNSIT
ncbi:2-C-methyl-D-erythritol 4-phosphate cytidylyltransferase [Onishia taeanensis]|jgi:2-C-methyl-D-erythritol 4-phosphate cytidylyltransferase|uniref:2-C-methyl-D-erythritol 4-phosphate cytidylyltransferase n=1 Tax=Onishia taeanensis TaxID=284577 RepID=A0A1G7MYA2_9GAMM|nr:2-C-methyl-D-erythritol 4-phosphate cytidylyltransferase [Halomonas taeanensis]MAX33505.1 2-C-methyl-D-erythritol 4-phosphate cytidylyltransferase [Halomonadaceae bacterium]SDF66646.1 2-C-methyl-D-erythritol 4-phosphate cytidylyltransferase [Halomonas taeanensis]